MALKPSNSSNLDQLALKELNCTLLISFSELSRFNWTKFWKDIRAIIDASQIGFKF